MSPRAGMGWSALAGRDRGMLISAIAVVALIIVLIAIFAPPADDSDPTPSSYSTETHGAKAAYLLLQQLGYHVERWNSPLADLATQANRQTVLIVAEPYMWNLKRGFGPVRRVLEQGGRVLAIGFTGGWLLPDNHIEADPNHFRVLCNAQPEGFGKLANSGNVSILPTSAWGRTGAAQSVAYTCSGRPVVVSYPVGKGSAVWWASAWPLENGGIAHGDNLALLLASIGPPAGKRVIWDESLHEGAAPLSALLRGTPLPLLWWQLGLVALLLLLSHGRRSGPLWPDPAVSRASSAEFVDSLGELYRKVHSANVAVTIAWERFALAAAGLLGAGPGRDARLLAATVASRLGEDHAAVERDFLECEDAAYGVPVPQARALELVQALGDHERRLRGQPKSIQ